MITDLVDSIHRDSTDTQYNQVYCPLQCLTVNFIIFLLECLYISNC